ncbi:MAG: hypothetical protein A3H97_03255 [Acidobacteria bacterium RIFCSPLOWO2_02_FULL_65_29]|nr:MAG: hypothetical protein A3H97_03255 [Acidobacteria bacterium RIFCSPLOWO2_02_FULL_65_29]
MLSSDEVHLLDRLVLSGLPAAAAGSSSGVRRARQRGAGLEFHEYRHYQPGDDPRSIDWTVEARLQQLVVRVGRADVHARLHVLVDVSRSMGVGTPPKLLCATKLAAALCYVAVERRDVAGVSTFCDAITQSVPPAAGRLQTFRVFEMLGAAAASGRSAVDRALVAYGAACRGPGMVVVVSDFLEPGSGLEGVQYLLHRGLTPALVQIVALEELEPDISNRTMLFDVEDATATPVVVDEAAVASYRSRMAEHTEALRAFCLTRGLPYMRVESTAALTELLSAAERAGVFTAYA